MVPLTRADEIKQLLSLHAALESDKSQRNAYWQVLHEYTIPHKAAMTTPITPSSYPYRRKYDNTGMLAAMDFAANMFAELSPPGRHWFLLSPRTGSEQQRDRQFAMDLGDRTDRLHQAMGTDQTNWATEIHNAYEDLAAGTCCVAVKRHPERPFTISTRPLREYSFLQDCEGRPDTVFVQRWWTAYEAQQRFGTRIDDDLVKDLQQREVSAYRVRRAYVNVHRPKPVAVTAPGQVRIQRAFESIWIDKDNQRELLHEQMRRLRYVIARFWRPTGLDWGMGPSDAAYPTIRGLDKTLEIVLKYAAKAMDPASLWPDDGAFHPQSTTPGAIIRGRMGPNDRGLPQYLQLQTDHRLAEFMFNYLSNAIAKAYLADVFKLMNDAKQRTAHEIVAILEKDYVRAVPVFARLKTELFDPLLRLCLEMMTEYELGIIGWMYQGEPLPQYEYELELISPLALAVKYSEIRKLGDLIAMHSLVGDIDPRTWFNYNLDEISRGIGENMGVPKRWMRPESERNAMRQAYDEQMERRDAIEQTAAASKATQSLGRPTDPSSVLAAIQGAA